MDKATSMSAALVGVLMAISITLATIAQQPHTNGETTTTTATQMVNFTQLFEQKFAGVSYLGVPPVWVVYQSPNTVILQGHANILNIKIALVNNKQLWQAVDIVKEHGFTVDSVFTSGLSTINNPLVYHIILSHNKT
jgi:hypothetical protein